MKQLIQEKSKYHRYAFVYPFSPTLLTYCRELKNKYGWKNFTFFDGKWRFNDLGIAWIIKQANPDLIVDPDLSAKMEQYKEEKQTEKARTSAALEIRSKKVSSIEIPNFKQPLYEYQKVGVEFFINNRGKAILADSPGAGKSAQSLAYLVYTGVRKALVVSPASVKYSWEGEVTKWTHLTPFVITSDTKQKDIEKGVEDNNVIIINYDILSKFKALLLKTSFEVMICDESHYLKTPTAIRTKAVKEIAEKIPQILLLSGTPMLSRPAELFTSLQLVDPHNWTNWHEYTVRYCSGHQGPWGWDARGASNIPELSKRIERYFIRRTKDEILPELPKKQYIDRVVELSKDDRFKYDLCMDDFEEYLREYRNKDAAQIEQALVAEKLVRLNELRYITTMGKLDAAKEIIDECLADGEKLLVFSVYNEPLEKLYEHYKEESFLLTGQTDGAIRGEMVKQFQSNPNKKIFFGGMKSAGVGITLTAASAVLFLDYSWTPSDHIQAADRVHRPGQNADKITIYQMVARDTIDSDMQAILSEKQGLIDKIIEQKDVGAEQISLIDDIYDRLKTKL